MMRSRSTPVDPNAFPMCSDVLSLDAYRSQMRFLRGQMWPARPAWPAWLARPAWPACLARWRAWPAWPGLASRDCLESHPGCPKWPDPHLADKMRVDT